jgi:hypothetical protein
MKMFSRRKAASRLVRSRILGGWQAASIDQIVSVGEADALKGWFGNGRRAAGNKED